MKNINKFVLVTGSESQMGKELCSKLIRNQFKVIKIDRFQKKQKDYYKIDFTNKIQIKNTLYKLTKKYKNINALFNLAASQVFTSFEKRTHEEIDQIMDVNIKSNILMTQFVFNKYFKKKISKEK